MGVKPTMKGEKHFLIKTGAKRTNQKCQNKQLMHSRNQRETIINASNGASKMIKFQKREIMLVNYYMSIKGLVFLN